MKPAQFASKLRKKIKNNESISEDHSKWLQDYERVVKRGRPAGAPPDISHIESPVADDSPPSVGGGGPPVDPPPIDVRSPASDGAPTQTPEAGRAHPPSGAQDSAKAATEEAGDRSEDKASEAAHLAKCQALTAGWVAWMKGGQNAIRQSGAKLPTLQDEHIDGIAPMMFESLVEYLPRSTGKKAGLLIVGGASAYNLIGIRRARAMQSQSKEWKPKDPVAPAPAPPPSEPPTDGQKSRNLVVRDQKIDFV